jgi:hypothetical protein
MKPRKAHLLELPKRHWLENLVWGLICLGTFVGIIFWAAELASR